MSKILAERGLTVFWERKELHIDVPKNSESIVRVRQTFFNGHDLVDVRVFFEGEEGEYAPSKKGVTLRVEYLPDLIEALQQLQGLIERQEEAV